MEYFFIFVIFIAQIIVTWTISTHLYVWSKKVKSLDVQLKAQKATIQLTSRQIKKSIKAFSINIKRVKSKISLVSFDTLIAVLNAVSVILVLRRTLVKKIV